MLHRPGARGKGHPLLKLESPRLIPLNTVATWRLWGRWTCSVVLRVRRQGGRCMPTSWPTIGARRVDICGLTSPSPRLILARRFGGWLEGCAGDGGALTGA